MTDNMSLLALLANASLVVKGVMLILLLLSIFSWAFIMQRHKFYKAAQEQADSFEKKFWSGIDLNNLYNKISEKQGKSVGQEAIFAAGFREYIRLHNQLKAGPDAVMQGVKRSMDIVLNKEVRKLEKSLPFLATVQSSSPYIGLFGTVWGIMHSFRQLAAVSQATIAMVAPGISEALIATAMGLIAAIPAGIAYNRYLNRADKISSQYQSFFDELLGLLHRNLYSKESLAKK